jgi:hypothetical protein
MIFTYDNPNEPRSWTGTSIVRIFEGGTIDFDIYHMARAGFYSLIVRYVPTVGEHANPRLVSERHVRLCLAANMGRRADRARFTESYSGQSDHVRQ